MMKKKTRKDWLEEAKKNHTDLCLFDTIASMVEGGGFSSNSQVEQFAIVATCKRAIQKCLARMDRAEHRVITD